MEDTFVIEKVKKKIFLPSRDLRPVKTWKKHQIVAVKCEKSIVLELRITGIQLLLKKIQTGRQTDRKMERETDRQCD